MTTKGEQHQQEGQRDKSPLGLQERERKPGLTQDLKPGLVAHSFNPSTGEAQVGDL